MTLDLSAKQIAQMRPGAPAVLEGIVAEKPEVHEVRDVSKLSVNTSAPAGSIEIESGIKPVAIAVSEIEIGRKRRRQVCTGSAIEQLHVLIPQARIGAEML